MPPVRVAGDVELASLCFVVAQNLIEKFWKNPIRIFEKQTAVRCAWADRDVAAALGLFPPVGVQRVFRAAQLLRSTGEHQDPTG